MPRLVFFAAIASLSFAADANWTRHVLDSGYTCQTVTAADFNADGIADVIAAGNQTKQIWLYASPKRVPILLFEGVDGIFASESLDADGDGDLDYAAARYSPGHVFWLERPLQPLTQPWTYHKIDDGPQSVNGVHGLFVADIDGDRRPDLIANSAQPKDPLPDSLVWFRQLPRGRFERHVFANRDAPGLSHYFGAGDLDGDGHLEIVSAAKDAPNGNWFAFWQRQGDLYRPWRRVTVAENQIGATNILVADANGDRRPDLIATRGHGKGVVWFEAPNWTPREIDANLAGPHSLAVADLDRDGDMDIATAAKDDQLVVWYENDGRGRFARHVIATGQGSYDLRVADMDGDKDLDVIVAGQASRNVVWFENPSPRRR